MPPTAAAEDVSECNKGAGHILSPPPGPNWDLTPSGDYFLTQYGYRTLRPSGEAAVLEYGLGSSFELIPGGFLSAARTFSS